jgi:hypothetical protein
VTIDGVKLVLGIVVVTMGLAVTALGTSLIMSGVMHSMTIVGAVVGPHEIGVGAVMAGIGVGITVLGGYLIYKSFSPRDSTTN